MGAAPRILVLAAPPVRIGAWFRRRCVTVALQARAELRQRGGQVGREDCAGDRSGVTQQLQQRRGRIANIAS